MHVLINVKSPNNISEWQMGFNSAFKVLIVSTRKLIEGMQLFCYCSFTKNTVHCEVTVRQIRYHIQICHVTKCTPRDVNCSIYSTTTSLNLVLP